MRVLILSLALAASCAIAPAVSLQSGRSESASHNVRLVLPPVIYAVTRIEANLYFDNVVLVLNRQNYAFEVICPKGVQLEERWTFTPEASDVGEYPIEVIVRDEDNAVLARATSKVIVVPFDRHSSGVTTLLLVGASLTEYSIYPQHLLDLDKKDGYLLLKFIGSRGPNDAPPTGELRHEGYSGWTAEAFVTLHGPLSRTGYYKRPDTGSPFVYETSPGKYQLDFARYCQEFNNGRGPDFLSIQLMPNDIFTAKDDTIDSRVDKMLGFYDTLIKEFHRVRPDTNIGVVLPAPPSRSQDGFRNYTGPGRQTRWQYRRNLHRAYERAIQRFSGREKDHIYLVPVYINFDTERHYPSKTGPASSRASESMARTTNGTHPSSEGYHQVADSIYSWVKAVVEPQRKAN